MAIFDTPILAGSPVQGKISGGIDTTGSRGKSLSGALVLTGSHSADSSEPMQNVFWLVATLAFFHFQSFFVLRRFGLNEWVTFGVAPYFAIGSFLVVVLCLGTFLQISIWICLALSTAFWIYLNWRHRKEILADADLRFWQQYVWAWLIYIFFWILLVKPFVSERPQAEVFDFFSHWGFAVRRFIVDGHVYHRDTIFEYSTYEYPILGALWSFLQSFLSDSLFNLRFKTLEVLCSVGVLGMGLLKERKWRHWGVFLLFFLVLLRVRLGRPPFFADGYSVMPDLIFGLLLMLFWFFYSMYVEIKDWRVLGIAGVFLLLQTHIRYDGIVSLHLIMASLFVIYILEGKRRNKEDWKWIAFAVLPSTLTSWLWLIYHSFEIVSGGFGEGNKALAPSVMPQMLMDIGKELPWLYPCLLISIVLVVIRIFLKKENVLKTDLLPIFTWISFLLFLAFFYATIWQYVVHVPRMVGRLTPLIVLLLTFQIWPFIKNALDPWIDRFMPRLFSPWGTGVALLLCISQVSYISVFAQVLNSNPNPVSHHPCVLYIQQHNLNKPNNLFVWRGPVLPNENLTSMNYFYREAIYPARVISLSEPIDAVEEKKNFNFVFRRLNIEDFNRYEVDSEKSQLKYGAEVLDCQSSY